MIFFLPVFLFSFFHVSVNAVIVRDYNKIKHEQYSSFNEFASIYLTQNDEEGDFIAQRNFLLGLASSECSDVLKNPFFRGVEHFAGGNSLFSVSLDKNAFPISVNHNETSGCSSFLFYKKGDRISSPSSAFPGGGSSDKIEFSRWIQQNTRISVSFFNEFPYPVDVYYHTESAQPLFQFTLPPGGSTGLTSFIGHVFSVSIGKEFLLSRRNSTRTGEENEIAIPSYILDEPEHRPEYQHEGFYHIVDYLRIEEESNVLSPNNRLETCEQDLSPSSFLAEERKSLINDLMLFPSSSDNSESFTSSPSVTSSSLASVMESICNNLFLRFVEFSHAIWYEKRLGSNFIQPQIVQAVTAEGFLHRKLPLSTYHWLVEWYQQKQQEEERAETVVGPCMNQQTAPSSITHLEPSLKNRLENELKPIMQEWYGDGDLYLTSIYGIRCETSFTV
jgi:hypothetical protein